MSAVLGIDPGGAATGLALRQGNRLLAHATVQREPAQTLTAYLSLVIQSITWYRNQANNVTLAVEGLNTPTPHMGVTSVRGLLDTASVLGAVLATWPTTTVVPPGGHGSAPLIAYPAELRPSRGQGRGRDALRHERSAYDVAGAAHTLHRIQEAITT